jgi:hypothetical protein
MSSIAEIEKAIDKLARHDFFQLVDHLRQRYAEEWDREIAEDSASGRLDFLLKEVDEDIAKGKTRPTDELCDEP